MLGPITTTKISIGMLSALGAAAGVGAEYLIHPQPAQCDGTCVWDGANTCVIGSVVIERSHYCASGTSCS